MNENEIANEMNRLLKKSSSYRSLSAEGCEKCKEWEVRYGLQSHTCEIQKQTAVNGLFSKMNKYIQYELGDIIEMIEDKRGFSKEDLEVIVKVRIKNVLRFMETRRKNDTTIEEK